MAGDAPGGRRDETDGSREPPTTDEGWNAIDSDANDRTTNADRITIDLSRDADDADDGAEADDPYAPEPSSTPIERGDPSLENTIFVVLGALAMILVIARVVSLPM